MQDLSPTHLRYLTAIDDLAREGRGVSSVDVARALRVKKPSVTRMLETLRERGLAEKERYGKIALTDEGTRLARQYADRLGRLTARLPEIGLDLTAQEGRIAAAALLQALPERYQNAL